MAEKTLRIRFAAPGDEIAISALIHALAEYEKAPEKCHATPEKVREMLFSERPAAETLLAIIDGQAVGFALFFQSFSTWVCRPGMYLEDLFVLPEVRRCGIGARLLRQLGRICLERNYGRLEFACLEWNELAKTQYRKIGAVPMEEWRTWRIEGERLIPLANGDFVARGPDDPGPTQSFQ
jgi:GNAT superfamily N-acetyltransferase